MKNKENKSNKANIKIFVSHRIDIDSVTIDNPLFVPIRCGAVYDKREHVTMLGDNTGDNISDKRDFLGEITVQYWAWKNVDADYYGLCHYRRYLSFSKKKLPEDYYGNINYNYIDDLSINELNLDETEMREKIEKHDLIVSKAFKCKSVYEQYKEVPYLNEEDLVKCLEIIDRISPEYSKAAHEYIKGKYFYPCCLFIMKKELYFEYCSWMFKILDEFFKETDFKNYGNAAYRTPGHIGERLLGIFYTYIKNKNKYSMCTLQRAIYWNTEKQEDLEPYFKLNNIPIVLTSSDYYIPYAAMTLQSIVKNSMPTNNYDVIFLYSNITDESKNILKDVIKNNKNFNLRFYNITPMIGKYKFISNNHVSEETFYRLFVQQIFKNYDRIVYLDSDLIIKRDISDLYNIDIKDNLIAATLDADWMSQYNGAIPKVKSFCKKVLKLDDPYKYFQAGVVMFNIKEMNKTFKKDELVKYASEREYMYVDQDVLNAKLQGRVFYLDLRWNVMTSCGGERLKNIKTYAPKNIADIYMEARKDPYIIHYAGYLKPWNSPYSDYANEFWNQARGTNLYEILLSRLDQDVSWHTTAAFLEHKVMNESKLGFKQRLKFVLKRYSYILFPLNSRRREKFKKIYFKFID